MNKTCTIICKKTGKKFYGKIIGEQMVHTGEKYYGKIIEEKMVHVNNNNRTVQYWRFETKVYDNLYSESGETVVWECLGDYWDLVYADLRKVEKTLRTKDKGVISAVKKLFTKGHCNDE